MKTYICPHCLGRFNYDNLWYSCPCKADLKFEKAHNEFFADKSKDRRLKTLKKAYRDVMFVDDRGIDDYITEDVSNGVFRYESKGGLFRSKGDETIPERVTCSICGNDRVTQHVCPNPTCHEVIEINKNEKQYIINLAGLSSSGKTSFLAAMFYAIDNVLRNITSKWTIELNEEAQDLRNQFARYVSDGTPIGGTNPEQSKPAIVTFREGLDRAYSFIFYDVAGEVFTNGEGFIENVRKARQFSYPDYIILFADPVNFSAIRNRIRENGEKYSESVRDYFNPTEPEQIKLINEMPRNEQFVLGVRRFIWEIINQYGTKKEADNAREKLPAPVAVCVSKADMLREIYDQERPEYAFLRTSPITVDGCGDFFSAHPANSRALESFINSLNEKAYVNTLRTNFKTVNFFSVSAMSGENSASDGNDARFFNVLDPFLWILSMIQGDGSDVKFLDILDPDCSGDGDNDDI